VQRGVSFYRLTLTRLRVMPDSWPLRSERSGREHSITIRSGRAGRFHDALSNSSRIENSTVL